MKRKEVPIHQINKMIFRLLHFFDNWARNVLLIRFKLFLMFHTLNRPFAFILYLGNEIDFLFFLEKSKKNNFLFEHNEWVKRIYNSQSLIV